MIYSIFIVLLIVLVCVFFFVCVFTKKKQLKIEVSFLRKAYPLGVAFAFISLHVKAFFKRYDKTVMTKR